MNYDYTDNENKVSVTTGNMSTGSDLSESARYGTDKPRKEKKGGKAVGKVFAALGLGIVFGLAAGSMMLLLSKVPEVLNDGNNAKDATAIEQQAGNGEKAPAEGNIKMTKTKPDDDSALPDEPFIESEVESDVDGKSEIIVTDVSDMVDEAMPSIVSITGQYVITGQSFWGQTYSEETEGSGSGIIIAQDDGKLYIATNNHVVEDSKDLKVQFIDGSKADATIKGTDADVDLAVIIVDLDDLDEDTKNSIKVASLGDSDAVKIGEPAVVIGNSLGYGQTVTYGVISAKDRELEMDDGTISKGLIQTDAAINPGNSGGALLNIKGEVIGISSSKIGGSVVDGVGFAIPITSAQPILSDIVTSVERTKVSENKQGYLGIGGQTVTDEVSNMYGLPVGVLVRQVYEGTGAEEGGLEQGDVITKLGDKKIESMEDLRNELQYYSKDDIVKVTVSRLRDGLYEDVTLDIRLVDKDALD